MNELNHGVTEQPVRCPASQAMLGSEKAGLCMLDCQEIKDET